MPRLITPEEALEQIKKNQAENEEVQKRVEKQESSSLNAVQRDGRTRSALTFWFLLGFFGLICWCFFFTLWYNNQAIKWIVELNKQGLSEEALKITFLELDKVLAVVIGALGTSLGFIIGYYFKDKQ